MSGALPALYSQSVMILVARFLMGRFSLFDREVQGSQESCGVYFYVRLPREEMFYFEPE